MAIRRLSCLVSMIPAINEGHNVSSGIPNGEMGMSRDCFEEYLCSNTGKPISLCGCHHPNMGYNAEMKNRDGRLLQTLCLPEPGRICTLSIS